MKKRVTLFLILAALLIPAAVFGAGGKESSASTGPVEITWFHYGPTGLPALSYWKDTLWVQELEKRLNIKLTFQGPPTYANYDDAVNTLLASGDLPDIIFWDWQKYNGGIEGAVRDGLILNFPAKKEYMDMLPNFTAKVNLDAQNRQRYTLPSGSLLPGFCPIYEAAVPGGPPKANTYQGYAIRQDWLDRVGKKVPTTIDELHDVLLAFKRQDANGNGDPNDEIPFSWDNGNLRTFYILMSAWGLQYNTPFYPDPQNPGKLTHWTLYKNGRAFTDMLTTLAQWYKEGLIDPDSFTQNNAQRLSKITSDKIGFTYVDPTNGVDWRDAIKKIRPDIAGQVKFTGVAPLTGPEGKPYTHNSYQGGGVTITEAAIITQKAEKQGKLPAILKLMDYMYSEAGTTLINYGVEGVSFTKDARGNLAWTPAMGADPQFPLKSKLIQYNLSYHGGWPKYALHDAWVLSNLYDPDSLQIHTAYIQGDTGLVFPVEPPPLSQADAQENARIMNDVNTAVNEFYVAVISGRRSVSEAPALFARLQTMGLGRALQINQAHYDRTKSR